MSKRILALLLCAFMLIPCFSGCSEKLEEGDLGAYITMYLTDDIYDFDPANAYYNQDVQNVVGMMFDTLFKLNANGKVEKSLVQSYSIKENEADNEYYMEITLKSTKWSNGNALTADDVVYAWKRLLSSSENFAAASLLYDIKNARAVKEGDESIDDIGIEAISSKVVKVTFEGRIDYDQFLLNLTNVATAPLYENYVSKNADWAKKPSSMVTSGPYKIGKIIYLTTTDENGKTITEFDDNALDQYGENQLYRGEIVSDDYAAKEINYFYLERNSYYYRTDDDAINKSVKNYRILVDCSKSDEELLQDYKDGKIFYMGQIPLSIRNDSFVAENVKISNALSTFVCYLNENALISDGGEGTAIFANADVRKALSLAIDRDAIQKAIVYAEAATGLVCPGIFNEGTSGDFREVGGKLIETSENVTEAEKLLAKAGINASEYSFTIKVAAYDDVHVKIAEMIAAAWGESGLGFNVTIHTVHPIENNDILKDLVGTEDPSPNDVCDDLLVESIQRGNYEVVMFDYVAYSADAYSMLSSFANSFSGLELIQTPNEETGAIDYSLTPHVTGYTGEAYNDLMEAVFYIPYFASFTEEQLADETFIFLSIYKEDDGSITAASHEEFLATYNKVKAIYEANGITPTTNKKAWAEQKAILLHKAEELLLADMPVIPVVFNQNAVLVSDELSGVSSNYYIPSHFAGTNLNDYAKYTEALLEFPEINWDLVQ